MSYSLRIYKRRRANDPVGLLAKRIDLKAKTDEEAGAEALPTVQELNFTSHYAVVMNDDASFIHFWLSGI